jgi:chromosome segregation ATPase
LSETVISFIIKLAEKRMSEEITQPLANDTLRLILARLDSIDARLDGLESRLTVVEERLATLEEKVDRRLQETRPIWEQVLARVGALENETREGFKNIRDEMNAGLRRVERQVDILNRNILHLQTDVDELDERVTKLESEPTQ